MTNAQSWNDTQWRQNGPEWVFVCSEECTHALDTLDAVGGRRIHVGEDANLMIGTDLGDHEIALPTQVTALEIAAAINAELPHIHAEATADGITLAAANHRETILRFVTLDEMATAAKENQETPNE